MTPNEAPATTNPYRLSGAHGAQPNASIGAALRRLAPLMRDERRHVVAAFVATVVAATASLLAPVIIARTVDTYIQSRDFGGVLRSAGVLLPEEDQRGPDKFLELLPVRADRPCRIDRQRLDPDQRRCGLLLSDRSSGHRHLPEQRR